MLRCVSEVGTWGPAEPESIGGIKENQEKIKIRFSWIFPLLLLFIQDAERGSVFRYLSAEYQIMGIPLWHTLCSAVQHL